LSHNNLRAPMPNDASRQWDKQWDLAHHPAFGLSAPPTSRATLPVAFRIS